MWGRLGIGSKWEKVLLLAKPPCCGMGPAIIHVQGPVCGWMSCKLSFFYQCWTVDFLSFFLQENDEFFELISSKFLTESRYSVSVQAATTRLLFSCSLTWMVW